MRVGAATPVFRQWLPGRPYWLWVGVGVLVDPFIVPEVVVGGGVLDD